MKKTLIIDSNYLCFRSMIALMGMSWEEKDTGVIFGFMKQIQNLAKIFDYPRFIFAWDSEIKPSWRQEFFPDYKKKDPKEFDPEMANLLEIGKPQFRELRAALLPDIGFKNQIQQPRLEADDMIAQLTKQIISDEIVIVSSDNDLYQLLTDRISMYDVKAHYTLTYDLFYAQWGISPDRWATVKELAGCDSDKVPGIPGIGIKTAIKYMEGLLPNGKKKQSIISNDNILKRNRKLVKLPYEKTQHIDLTLDNFSHTEFVSICMDYGMLSLINKEENFKIWRQILK